MRVSGLRRVLVVDPESETEEVLKAVFEPRGLQVDRIQVLDSPRRGSALPSLLVIDDDGLSAEPSGTNEWGSVPRVIIGSARLPENTIGKRQCYLQKPFQYPELIRMIDQLLAERAA
jgi:CheY-like chemotaxis protein